MLGRSPRTDISPIGPARISACQGMFSINSRHLISYNVSNQLIIFAELSLELESGFQLRVPERPRVVLGLFYVGMLEI